MSMRISELARAGGVSLPTVKYYLREGLLPPGRATAATQAEYDESHVARLRLVRALVDVGGLSLAAVREVLATLDTETPGQIHQAVGQAHAALGRPPAPDPDHLPSRALALLTELGWAVDPQAPALRQLDTALATLDELGMAMGADQLHTYAQAALVIATSDVARVPTGSAADAVAFVVLGTVLNEPVLLALRRLAQAHAYYRLHGPAGDG